MTGKHANGKPIRTGFFVETVQSAVASYQPQVPEGESLDAYLDRLIAAAKSGAEPQAASSRLTR